MAEHWNAKQIREEAERADPLRVPMVLKHEVEIPAGVLARVVSQLRPIIERAVNDAVTDALVERDVTLREVRADLTELLHGSVDAPKLWRWRVERACKRLGGLASTQPDTTESFPAHPADKGDRQA